MVIEIRGTGTHNKGAELMAATILQQLRQASPSALFAVDPLFGPFEDRARYGLRSLLPRQGKSRGRFASWLLPKSFRQKYGLIGDQDVSCVLDASGFAFGDQWGSRVMKALAARFAGWKRRGIPVIFLPQAFGPFSDADIRKAAAAVFAEADFVFARDEESLSHLRSLGITGNHVSMAPDFTNLIKGTIPDSVKLPERFVCLVPNIRMLRNRSEKDGNDYLNFMARAIDRCESMKLACYFLFHDPAGDQVVADRIMQELGRRVPVIESSSALDLKGILGRAHFVIGSRYHALIGALCQGVPVIATSWSHKYEALLADYGIRDFILSPGESATQLDFAIERLVSEPEQEKLRSLLLLRAEELRLQSSAMMESVKKFLFNTTASK